MLHIVCRNGEVRVFRVLSRSSPDILQLCVDDVWFTLNYSLQDATEQPSTEQPSTRGSPQNLQLISLPEDSGELFLSWDTPLTNEEVTSYNIVCSANIPSGSGQPTTSHTLSLTTNNTSVILPVLGQKSVDYACCVTAQSSELFPTPTCSSVQIVPPPASTAGVSDSILVPVLGVLVGVFFLALVVVSVLLVVFMCTGTSRTTTGEQTCPTETNPAYICHTETNLAYGVTSNQSELIPNIDDGDYEDI